MNNIEENINRTLNSLDDLQRATPGDFFFTRVSARLLNKQQTVWEMTARFYPALLLLSVDFVL